MKHPPSDPSQVVQLRKIAHSLEHIRNSLMLISLALMDLVTELPSIERDVAMAEVKRHLNRIRLQIDKH